MAAFADNLVGFIPGVPAACRKGIRDGKGGFIDRVISLFRAALLVYVTHGAHGGIPVGRPQKDGFFDARLA